jgi:hypothetical protein
MGEHRRKADGRRVFSTDFFTTPSVRPTGLPHPPAQALTPGSILGAAKWLGSASPRLHASR